MKKFKTIISVIIMAISGIIGLYFGGVFQEALNGAILFSMIAGIACIICTLDNQ